MRTRRTLFTPKGMQKTPEIQQQIANDARLARKLSDRIHSPKKKGIRKGNRRVHNSRVRKSRTVTATPKKLDFGDEKEGH
jgi:hypothetical protein